MTDQPLALTGGTVVVSVDPVEVLVADVTVEGDRVISVGPVPPGAVRRDCSGTVLIPGNVCAHHHLYSALSRGMPYHLAPPRSFLEILQRVWWRLDRALDEESIRLSALVGGLEALKAGTTTVVDHHASPNFIDGSLDVIADALGELGLRSVLCYEVTDRDGPARAAAGVAENRRFAAARRVSSRGLVGAHASFTLSPETLAACVDTASGLGVGVHVHVAEDDTDERDAVARYGVGVVERLATAGVLSDRALLAHCVRIGGPAADRVVASGATVAHNMRSNMNNSVGRSALADGPGRVALGTDGIGGDMFAESQAAYFRAREASVGADMGWPLHRLAEGARFVGRVFDEPALGRLVPGAPADITVLDYPLPTPLVAGNLAGHWVFGLSAARVRDVMVAGSVVVADGRSTRVDEAKLAAEAHVATEQLWARLMDVAPHEFTPGGGSG